MRTIETWTCPKHGVVAKGERTPEMLRIVTGHRVNDHCYEPFYIHSEDAQE